MLWLEIAIVALLVIVNGLLSMSELAVVSARPARLKVMADRGVPGARRALALGSDPGRFLSAVQIGITLVGVLSGAFSGATLGQRVSQWLIVLGLPDGWADALGVGMVVALITYASLIIGELVPKQIALRDAEGVAARVAPAMTVLARFAAPLVWLLDVSGRLVLRLLGQSEKGEGGVTEEEIKTIIAEAENAGVLEPGEKEMIASVMRLGDRPVSVVMTPRREVDVIDLADDPVTIRNTIAESVHSRLPVVDGSPDEVIGILAAKDLLNAFMAGDPVDPRDFVKKAPIILDSADALDVVRILKESPVHIGLVHDEYGHFEGVVTTADILESIVGAFHTDEGPAEPMAVQRDDGSWLISGAMPADELVELIGIPNREDRGYHTVAGFVLEGFGHLPQVGESFDAHGWRFEVMDLDGRRIDKILASRLSKTRRALA